jgi:uncharacterized protein (TIGR03067 family)
VKRQWIGSLLLISFFGSFARGDAAAERREIEGTWLPVSAELAGEKYPEEVLKTMKLVLKGEKYTVEVGGQSDEGTITLDPAQSPKAMDIKGTKGPNEGKTFLVIYELKGDEMRVCYDLSGKSRPSEFATKAGTQLFLVKYRRTKA